MENEEKGILVEQVVQADRIRTHGKFHERLFLLLRIIYFLIGMLGVVLGNYNAHFAAYPDFDWERFSKDVVEKSLGLTYNEYTIQIEPHDYMAGLIWHLSVSRNCISQQYF